MDAGSGGIGFVTIGFAEIGIGLLVLLLVLYVVWKLAKILWIAVSG
jgi:hypothetical protein